MLASGQEICIHMGTVHGCRILGPDLYGTFDAWGRCQHICRRNKNLESFENSLIFLLWNKRKLNRVTEAAKITRIPQNNNGEHIEEM